MISLVVSSQKSMPAGRPSLNFPLADTTRSQLSFVLDSLCYITDDSCSLEHVIEELEVLLQGKDTVVKILHIGDSHIQAGFYSGQAMRMLQETFGNAGRGWIAPFKLANDNEPLDYFIQSSTVKNWTVGRCNQREPKCPWGPGGIALQTSSNFADFKIRISPTKGAGYAFNEVHFYRDREAIPMLPVGAHCEIVETSWSKMDAGIVIDTFRISAQIDSLHFHTAAKKELPEDCHGMLESANRYYGFSLMNGESGVLYHSVGHNGAMFVNYTDSDFIRQLSLFEPSLLVISLGTNEAFGYRFREDEFESQIRNCIRLIREYMPHTAILMTTPAECYRRIRKKGYQRNMNMEKVAHTIRAYAQQEGIACFDLFAMTGGANSCKHWSASSLYGKDRIHFTIRGYEEQGKLLYKSLIRLMVDHQNK